MQLERIMLKTEALSIEPTPHAVYVSIREQKLYQFFCKELRQMYTISTSRKPPSCKEDSLGTPLGLHRIEEKIGADAPKGMVFKARAQQGRSYDQMNADENKPNLITSRILWLKGLEDGMNAGKGCDTYKRFIYMHGTNHEQNLGSPDSHGCVLLFNDKIIKLFEEIPVGTLVLIER